MGMDKKLHVVFNGTSPLIEHNPQGVNPLNKYTLALGEITGKAKKDKTEEDYIKISDLEWESGLYWNDDIGLVVPNECLFATITEGAKVWKQGKNIQKFTQIVQGVAPLDIGEKQDYEKLKKDMRFRDVRTVRVKTARVIRTRPRFSTWRTEFDLVYDDEKIDVQTIIRAIEYAGNYVGLMEMRQFGYGRFAASVSEVEMVG